MTNKKYLMDNENVEYGVESRYISKKEKESDSIALMQARLERMKNLTKQQILSAKLLQLKLKMENYVKQPVCNNDNHFTGFLETYIDAMYSKRSNFAEDININPVLLSQVINNHREPKEEFILKLMIHSEKAFKDVCIFNKTTWYEVYYQEKICDTISSQASWRPRIENQVKLRKLRFRQSINS